MSGYDACMSDASQEKIHMSEDGVKKVEPLGHIHTVKAEPTTVSASEKTNETSQFDPHTWSDNPHIRMMLGGIALLILIGGAGLFILRGGLDGGIFFEVEQAHEKNTEVALPQQNQASTTAGMTPEEIEQLEQTPQTLAGKVQKRFCERKQASVCSEYVYNSESGDCVLTDISPCCGNALCESGESLVCTEDCNVEQTNTIVAPDVEASASYRASTGQYKKIAQTFVLSEPGLHLTSIAPLVTEYTGDEATLLVYKMSTDDQEPEQGELVTGISFRLTNVLENQFYPITFETAVPLESGVRYSFIIEVRDPDTMLTIAHAGESDHYREGSVWYYDAVRTHPQHSWRNVSDEDIAFTLVFTDPSTGATVEQLVGESLVDDVLPEATLEVDPYSHLESSEAAVLFTTSMETARAALKQGNYNEAIDHYKVAFSLEPNNITVREEYVLSLVYANRVPEAQSLFVTTEGQLLVTDSRYYLSNGSLVLNTDAFVDAYASINDHTNVILILSERVARDPTNAQAHLALAVGYLTAGDTLQAIFHIEKASNLDPDFEEEGDVLIDEIMSGGLF